MIYHRIFQLIHGSHNFSPNCIVSWEGVYFSNQMLMVYIKELQLASVNTRNWGHNYQLFLSSEHMEGTCVLPGNDCVTVKLIGCKLCINYFKAVEVNGFVCVYTCGNAYWSTSIYYKMRLLSFPPYFSLCLKILIDDY